MELSFQLVISHHRDYEHYHYSVVMVMVWAAWSQHIGDTKAICWSIRQRGQRERQKTIRRTSDEYHLREIRENYRQFSYVPVFCRTISKLGRHVCDILLKIVEKVVMIESNNVISLFTFELLTIHYCSDILLNDELLSLQKPYIFRNRLKFSVMGKFNHSLLSSRKSPLI